jgi:hypothetical protein
LRRGTHLKYPLSHLVSCFPTLGAMILRRRWGTQVLTLILSIERQASRLKLNPQLNPQGEVH